jgi:hypothetical protein
MLNMVLPFESGAGRARNTEHDELIVDPRQNAFEFQIKAERLDPFGQRRMVEQRKIRPAEAFALGTTPRGDTVVERLGARGEFGRIHLEHGHCRSPIRDRTRRARRR